MANGEGRLLLIGMPAAGKSTLLGSLRALGWTCSDADEVFAGKFGISCAEAIKKLGEEEFLRMQELALADSELSCARAVATGGAAIYSAGALGELAAGRTVVWLDGEDAELEKAAAACRDWEGLARRGAKTFAELREQRRPLYEAFADARVCLPAGCADLAGELGRRLGDGLRGELGL